MKRVKKVLSVVLAVIALTTVLPGCSGGGTSSESVSSSNAASQAAGTSSNKTIVFSGPDEWVKSQLQTTKGGYAKAVEKFEKANPGVTVKLSSEPWGTWQQKLPVVIASGDVPDVFMLNGPDAATFYNGGYLTDLSGMDKDFLAKFYPGVLKSYYGDNGALMALPFTTDCRVLWYNKDIFKAAGLDPSNPPKTWDELVAYAKKCASTTVNGQKVYGFGMDLGLKEVPTASLLCASDAMLFDAKTKTPTVKTDVFKKYLQTLVDMKDTFEPDYATLTHEGVAPLFGQKKVAMAIAGAWIWSLNPNLEKEDWYAMAPVPKENASAQDSSLAGGWALGISSKSKNMDLAKKFAQSLYDEDVAYMLSTDVPPVQGADAKCDLFQNPRAKVFVDQMKNGRKLMPPSTSSAEINSLFWEEASKAIMGKATVDQALDNIQNRMTTVLKSN